MATSVAYCKGLQQQPPPPPPQQQQQGKTKGGKGKQASSKKGAHNPAVSDITGETVFLEGEVRSPCTPLHACTRLSLAMENHRSHDWHTPRARNPE
eukprot:COSAG05_NODE_13006_length_445_cov_0.794798_1_plen_95_part_10